MIKTVLYFFLILVIILIVLSCGQSNKSKTTPSTAAVDTPLSTPIDIHKDGKKIYDIYCKMCHGEDGQQELTGTYNLVTSSMTIDQIIVITKEGKSTMMPYDAILSNKDLVDVSRYVLSMQMKSTE